MFKYTFAEKDYFDSHQKNLLSRPLKVSVLLLEPDGCFNPDL